MSFIAKVKRLYPEITENRREEDADTRTYEFRTDESVVPYETEFTIPEKFQHVDIEKVYKAETKADELLSVLKKVHPWSSLYYGLSATDVVRKLYLGMDTQILWTGT
jgi:exodeoxyribonuclease V alpha subunit